MAEMIELFLKTSIRRNEHHSESKTVVYTSISNQNSYSFKNVELHGFAKFMYFVKLEIYCKKLLKCFNDAFESEINHNLR